MICVYYKKIGHIMIIKNLSPFFNLTTHDKLIDSWAGYRNMIDRNVFHPTVEECYVEDTKTNKFIQVYPALKELSQKEVTVIKLISTEQQ